MQKKNPAAFQGTQHLQQIFFFNKDQFRMTEKLLSNKEMVMYFSCHLESSTSGQLHYTVPYQFLFILPQ